MREPPSARKRLWSQSGWLDSIDVLIYGGLGIALLACTIYDVAGALLASGHETAFVALVVVVALSAASLVRDFRRRQFTPLSKAFAGAWALLVVLVVVVELIESFS